MNITVKVNNNRHSFSKEISLSESIKQLSIQEKGIAIAVNNRVVEKLLWKSTILNNNDTILIITATQGG